MKSFKKVLVSAVCFILLLVANVAMAKDIRVSNGRGYITVKEVCINGYAFVIAVSPEGGFAMRSTSVIQVYRKGETKVRPPQPKECTN